MTAGKNVHGSLLSTADWQRMQVCTRQSDEARDDSVRRIDWRSAKAICSDQHCEDGGF